MNKMLGRKRLQIFSIIDQNDAKACQTGGLREISMGFRRGRGYRFYKGAHSIKNYKQKTFPGFKTGI